jgi:hypothetical protein
MLKTNIDIAAEELTQNLTGVPGFLSVCSDGIRLYAYFSAPPVQGIPDSSSGFSVIPKIVSPMPNKNSFSLLTSQIIFVISNTINNLLQICY